MMGQRVELLIMDEVGENTKVTEIMPEKAQLETLAPMFAKVLQSFCTYVATELEADALNASSPDVASALTGVAHHLQCADFDYIVNSGLSQVLHDTTQS